MASADERRLRAKALRYLHLYQHAARHGFIGRANQLLRAYRRTKRALNLARKDYIGDTHFTWDEAVRNSGYASKDRLPADVRQGVIRHAADLERLRTAINRERQHRHMLVTGIAIISWVRSPAKNRDVGGAGDSRHLHGDATDHSVQEVRRLCPWGGFDAIADRAFSRGGFGQYPGGNRHVDSRGYRARWSSWTAGR